MINATPVMDKQTDSKIEWVLREWSYGKDPIGEKVLDEKQPSFPFDCLQ
jgi:hypothetical protein